MSNTMQYFSVVIPFASKGATQWHPTASVGPFSTLTRGAFGTKKEAHAWAAQHLQGHPYSIKRFS